MGYSWRGTGTTPRGHQTWVSQSPVQPPGCVQRCSGAVRKFWHREFCAFLVSQGLAGACWGLAVPRWGLALLTRVSVRSARGQVRQEGLQGSGTAAAAHPELGHHRGGGQDQAAHRLLQPDRWEWHREGAGHSSALQCVPLQTPICPCPGQERDELILASISVS